MVSSHIIRSWRMRLLILTVLALALRAYVLFNTDSWPDSEAAGRQLMAREWADNPCLVPDLNFGPLYYYVNGGLLRFFDDTVLVPRLVSLLAGSLLIIPIYFLVNLVFGTPAALFSSLAVCFYPLHVRYSVLGTADSLFILFLFCAIYYSLKCISSGTWEWRDMFLAVIFLNLSSMVRFEGWFFTAVICLLFFLRGKRHKWLFACAVFVFPLFWMAVSYLNSGDPLLFNTTSARESGRYLASIPLLARVGYWPYILSITLTPVLVAFGFAGVAISFFRKNGMFLAGIFVCVLAVFMLRTATGKFETLPRYSMPLGLLLIPYAVFAINYFSGKAKSVAGNYPPVIISLLVLAAFCGMIRRDISIMQLPYEEKALSVWLRSNVTAQERVMFDIKLDVTEALRLYSRLPLSSVHVPLRTAEEGMAVINKNESTDFFLQNRPRYIVISSIEPAQERFSGFSPDDSYGILKGCGFERVYKNGNYAVFRSS